jgi:hypothetical protein
MSSYQHYLFDLGLLLKEYAFDAVDKLNSAAPGTPEHEFNSGRVFAYYQVISLMQQQAEVFEIPLKDLRLDDIVPDRDL